MLEATIIKLKDDTTILMIPALLPNPFPKFSLRNEQLIRKRWVDSKVKDVDEILMKYKPKDWRNGYIEIHCDCNMKGNKKPNWNYIITMKKWVFNSFV